MNHIMYFVSVQMSLCITLLSNLLHFYKSQTEADNILPDGAYNFPYILITSSRSLKMAFSDLNWLKWSVHHITYSVAAVNSENCTNLHVVRTDMTEDSHGDAVF